MVNVLDEIYNHLFGYSSLLSDDSAKNYGAERQGV
jgi:hypothetical protein